MLSRFHGSPALGMKHARHQQNLQFISTISYSVLTTPDCVSLTASLHQLLFSVFKYFRRLACSLPAFLASMPVLKTAIRQILLLDYLVYIYCGLGLDCLK